VTQKFGRVCAFQGISLSFSKDSLKFLRREGSLNGSLERFERPTLKFRSAASFPHPKHNGRLLTIETPSFSFQVTVCFVHRRVGFGFVFPQIRQKIARIGDRPHCIPRETHWSNTAGLSPKQRTAPPVSGRGRIVRRRERELFQIHTDTSLALFFFPL
jgi:hypothetical protein